jgi:hypothetical protein
VVRVVRVVWVVRVVRVVRVTSGAEHKNQGLRGWGGGNLAKNPNRPDSLGCSTLVFSGIYD